MFGSYTLEQYNNGVKYVVLYSDWNVEDTIQIVDDIALSNMKSDPFISKFKQLGYIVWQDDKRYIQCNNITNYLYLINHQNKSYQ